MSRFTTPSFDDFIDGSIPQWYVTRFKNSLSAAICPNLALGTATDRNVDPLITTISTTLAGTADVCNTPTQIDWSSKVSGMIFRAEIVGNTAGTLTVDLEFYRAVYGDSGGVEDWQLIQRNDDISNGEEVQLATGGSRVFVRIAGVTNPDGNAQLYLSARKAMPDEAGGAVADLDVEEGKPVRGMLGWSATLNSWVKWAVGAAGFPIVEARQATAALLNNTEVNSTAILADTTAILLDTTAILADTAVIAGDTTSMDATLTSVVEDHDVNPIADAAIVKVGGETVAGIPAARTAGRPGRLVVDQAGGLRVVEAGAKHYTLDSETTRETPASGGGEGSTQIANAAAPTPLAAASTPCIGVEIQNQVGNAPIAVGFATLTGVVNAADVLIGGASMWFPIDDVQKAYGWSTNNNERLDYTYFTRA